MFGEDFHRARHNWLYNATNSLPLWFAILALVLAFLLNMFLQGVAAVAIAPLMEGGLTDPRAIIKGTILGMLPVAVLTVVVA